MLPFGSVNSMTDGPALPAPLAAIRDDFLELGEPDRLQLLLEFSNELPELPERFRDHPELLERVEECQSPVFIVVEAHDGVVQVHATAPAESPTTRGFASILAQGLSGLEVETVLGTPDDFPLELGLTKAVSPLRLRGMTGMLARIKRQLRAAVAA
jgi:cysteine desulfuration protein SufE